MIPAILSLAVVSFAIAGVGTLVMKRVAPRIGFVDKPGHRKIHRQPIPLGGGVAIFWAFVLPLLGAVVAARLADPAPPPCGGRGGPPPWPPPPLRPMPPAPCFERTGPPTSAGPGSSRRWRWPSW